MEGPRITALGGEETPRRWRGPEKYILLGSGEVECAGHAGTRRLPGWKVPGRATMSMVTGGPWGQHSQGTVVPQSEGSAAGRASGQGSRGKWEGEGLGPGPQETQAGRSWGSEVGRGNSKLLASTVWPWASLGS